jgi:hypothetical protein
MRRSADAAQTSQGRRLGGTSQHREQALAGTGGSGRYLLGGGTVVAGVGIASAGPWLIVVVFVLAVFALCTGLLFGYLPTVGPDGLGWQRVGSRARRRG